MAIHPTPTTQILAVLSSVLLLSLCWISAGKPNTSVKSVLCNSGTYTKGDPFTVSLAYVLAELQSATPSRRSYDFRNISPYPNALAYSHAACNQTLTTSDCSDCLSAAEAAMLGSCDGRIGGRGELFDCVVRYEQYPFDD